MSFACIAETYENIRPSVREIGQGLLDCTLPHHMWTHEAHFAAALYVVMARPDLDAQEVMPGLIRRYNEHNGVENTDHSGFHATITGVYVRAISDFVSWLPAGITTDEAFDCLMSTPIADREYPLYFYSKNRLMSVDARRNWVEPDLQPMSLTFFLGNQSASSGTSSG